MKILKLEEIKSALNGIDLFSEIEDCFVAYSRDAAVVPPVGELLLEKGEVHIKYGYIKQQEFYVIKIASGFYGNADLGLPTGSGMMLLFRQETGMPEAILLDEGHLTDVRTAVAGGVAAKALAPSKVNRIGILGTGVQARLQLKHLETVTECRDVIVWGRGEDQLVSYCEDVSQFGFKAVPTTDAAEVSRSSDLIVTTTPSHEPLLFASDLRKGTHITAVGSDTVEKQELDPQILAEADVVVADSISQCRERGEISKAVLGGYINPDKPVELGNVLEGKSAGRTNDEQITVADLTGVAVQDIAIASAVYDSFR